MALKGPGVYEKHMANLVVYWVGRPNTERLVKWSCRESSQLPGWTEEDIRLYKLISRYIRRVLKVEKNVDEGTSLSVHRLLETGAMDLISTVHVEGPVCDIGTS